MEKPVFVLSRKYFHITAGVHTPFTPSSVDLQLFSSFDKAREAALFWAYSQGKDVVELINVGQLSRASAQYDDLVFSVSVHHCFTDLYVTVGAEIYQKYVL